jgi:hypothetical protein
MGKRFVIISRGGSYLMGKRFVITRKTRPYDYRGGFDSNERTTLPGLSSDGRPGKGRAGAARTSLPEIDYSGFQLQFIIVGPVIAQDKSTDPIYISMSNYGIF